MQKELAAQLVSAVKEELPEVDLSGDEIARVTMITLSTMANFLRKSMAFNVARFYEFVWKSIKSHLELD